MSMVAVSETPSSIGKVELSRKKSGVCSTKPRSVCTGPPDSTWMSSARLGRLMRS